MLRSVPKFSQPVDGPILAKLALAFAQQHPHPQRPLEIEDGGVYDAHLSFSAGAVEVGLYVADEAVYVMYIETKAGMRGRGFARRALAAVCDWADRDLIELRLSVAPYHGAPMNENQLWSWYERCGFQQRDEHSPFENRMVRYPMQRAA